ncbi:hypothetical protein B0H17DRAFT_1075198, partial [Mycena rosella]
MLMLYFAVLWTFACASYYQLENPCRIIVSMRASHPRTAFSSRDGISPSRFIISKCCESHCSMLPLFDPQLQAPASSMILELSS